MKRERWLIFTGAIAILADSALLAYHATPVVGLVCCLIGGVLVGLAASWLLGWWER